MQQQVGAEIADGIITISRCKFSKDGELSGSCELIAGIDLGLEHLQQVENTYWQKGSQEKSYQQHHLLLGVAATRISCGRINNLTFIGYIGKFHSSLLTLLEHKQVDTLFYFALTTNFCKNTFHLRSRTNSTIIVGKLALNHILLHHQLLAIALHSELQSGMQLLD